jgi:hypothetical protein
MKLSTTEMFTMAIIIRRLNRMQIRPVSNNTGLRVYNDNEGSGQVIEITLEAGDKGTIIVPPNYKIVPLYRNELGETVYSFGPQ